MCSQPSCAVSAKMSQYLKQLLRVKIIFQLFNKNTVKFKLNCNSNVQIKIYARS